MLRFWRKLFLSITQTWLPLRKMRRGNTTKSFIKLNHLQLPPLITSNNSPRALPKVAISTTIGNKKYHWEGRLVRTEGVLDQRSRVLYVVAEIDDPYGINSVDNESTESENLIEQKQPLRIGTFVDAKIEGRLMKDLVVLPRRILRSGNHVWVIDKNNFLQNRNIETLTTEGEHLYVTSGLQVDELVSLSSINGSTPGTLIRINSTKLSSTFLNQNRPTINHHYKVQNENQSPSRQSPSGQSMLKVNQHKPTTKDLAPVVNSKDRQI